MPRDSEQSALTSVEDNLGNEGSHRPVLRATRSGAHSPDEQPNTVRFFMQVCVNGVTRLQEAVADVQATLMACSWLDQQQNASPSPTIFVHSRTSLPPFPSHPPSASSTRNATHAAHGRHTATTNSTTGMQRTGGELRARTDAAIQQTKE